MFVARGVDFQDVTLVLQLHPPSDASNYIHRAGRTGRAGRAGECITLHDPSEGVLVKRVRELTRQKFVKVQTPEAADIHHAAVSRLLDELMTVPVGEYTPLLAHATKLIEDEGPRVLATAMAVLDGRQAELSRAVGVAPSMLSGRTGYVCLLVYDPDHEVASTPADVQRVFKALLPKGAQDDALGRVSPTVNGWAVDVYNQFAAPLVEDLRSGRSSAPYEISIARELPKLLRQSAKRADRLPWASRKSRTVQARRRAGVPLDRSGPRFDGRWAGAGGKSIRP